MLFSSKEDELLFSYLLTSHAYKELRGGGEHRNMTGEPWLGRNNGHKEEFLRYRQLSKLSSAFAWAAVFALYFLNPWITLYNKNNRVKTDFLKQRKQSVFLKDYPILVGKWNSRKKKKKKKSLIKHMGQPPTWGYFDRLHQIKTLIRNSSIPTVSTVFV